MLIKPKQNLKVNSKINPSAKASGTTAPRQSPSFSPMSAKDCLVSSKRCPVAVTNLNLGKEISIIQKLCGSWMDSQKELGKELEFESFRDFCTSTLPRTKYRYHIIPHHWSYQNASVYKWLQNSNRRPPGLGDTHVPLTDTSSLPRNVFPKTCCARLFKSSTLESFESVRRSLFPLGNATSRCNIARTSRWTQTVWTFLIQEFKNRFIPIGVSTTVWSKYWFPLTTLVPAKSV